MLPVGVLAAFLAMKLAGVGSNIMSLGGIAISIGAMVDAAIVMVEEKGVVERGGLTPVLLVIRLVQAAVQDQISQDGLFLLPPGLAVVPDEAVEFLAGSEHPLDDVVPAVAHPVSADFGHQLGDFFRQGDIVSIGANAVNAH